MNASHGLSTSRPAGSATPAPALGLQAWDESALAPISDFMLTRVYAVGMPAERRARIAARRAFVRVKLHAVNAVANLPGAIGNLLRAKVRRADDMAELAELREVILALMPDESEHERAARAALQQAFDRAFGDSTLMTTARPSLFDTSTHANLPRR